MAKYSKVLVKTDRNGTKYFAVKDICPRCGGRGDYILGNLNYGICFECYGRGTKEYTVKEYTPEYEAKLEARRKARQDKRNAEAAKYAEEHADEIAKARQETIERRYAEFGCGKNGVGYALIGKTFPVKDQIKKNGGRWIYGAWVCPVEIKGEGIETHEINLNGHIGAGSEMWLDNFNIFDAIHG